MPQNLEYFKSKISAKQFLQVFEKLYGSIDSLKFEWHEQKSLDGSFDCQLTTIYKSALTETGIQFQADLWDFFDREPEVEEFKKLENEFQISGIMEPFTKGNLPLIEFYASSKDLIGENKSPSENAEIWLGYGSY